MIRINLLPVKQKQRQYTVVYQLVVGGVVMLIVLAGCSIDHLLQKAAERRLANTRDKLTREIAELERLIGEVREFEKKEAELNRKLGVIETLRSNKVGPVKLLEELSVTIPKKVWVTSIKETTTPPANHHIALTGNAISDEVIAEFMTKLEESDYFFGVELIEARAAGEKQGASIQSFQLTANFAPPPKKGSGQQASLPAN